jgi:hypothetical protein
MCMYVIYIICVCECLSYGNWHMHESLKMCRLFFVCDFQSLVGRPTMIEHLSLHGKLDPRGGLCCF